MRDVPRSAALIALLLAAAGCGDPAPSPPAIVDASVRDAPSMVDVAAPTDLFFATDTAAFPDVPRVPPHPGEDGGCNGLRANCTRSYDRVAIAATHNAFAYAAGGPVRYVAPNQDLPVPDQLAAGIRGLGLRPCPYFGADPDLRGHVFVTHNSGLRGVLGTEALDGILRQIKAFLDAHPREVVTLYLESSVPDADVAAVFDQVGLGAMLFAPDATGTWPTLQAMIDAGRRLVVFNDSSAGGRPPWMLYLWDHLVDTDYNVIDAAQFSCAFYRGHSSNAIYYLNEFIYRDLGNGVVVPSEVNARVANARAFILDRARRCRAETGRAASVVYVDWFGQGDVVGAVDELNREASGDAGP